MKKMIALVAAITVAVLASAGCSNMSVTTSTSVAAADTDESVDAMSDKQTVIGKVCKNRLGRQTSFITTSLNEELWGSPLLLRDLPIDKTVWFTKNEDGAVIHAEVLENAATTDLPACQPLLQNPSPPPSGDINFTQPAQVCVVEYAGQDTLALTAWLGTYYSPNTGLTAQVRPGNVVRLAPLGDQVQIEEILQDDPSSC